MTMESDNPLLASWTDNPFQLPPFTSIQPSHFPPAFDIAMAQHKADLQAIVDNTDTPTFENTIAEYDRTGPLLDRVSHVFSNMCSSLNTDELKSIQTEMVPLLSRHSSSTYTLEGLFEKIQTVYNQRETLELTPEQIRLVERLNMDFTRQGASFSPEEKKEYADIKARLAELMTEFSQNVMKDEETYEILLTLEDMEGCPDSLIDAARNVALERNKGDGEYVITLSRSYVEPFLTFSSRRNLREKAWRAWTKRGELNDERANLPLALETLKLRKRQAEMHGCKTFAEYQCKDMVRSSIYEIFVLL
jgi:peptidyl-dipeptidase Dcp